MFASDENEELLKNSPQWEQDYKLSAPADHSMALFGEFMEMSRNIQKFISFL